MVSSLPLTFLRPMALPRPATLHRFLGVARVSTTTTTATSVSAPLPPPQAATAAGEIKPYRLTRTPSNLYPVYTLKKRGGNMKLTKVRRIEGDVNVLRTDLKEALGLDEKEISINQLTKQIIVKGHKKHLIEQFLKDNQL